VVKVVNGGSSIGVYICNTKEELSEALIEAESFHMDILVEEKIEGRELTIPILDDKALNAIEIIPPEGKTTFDYVAKYQSGEEGAREICPADISADQQALLGELALRLHKALGLSIYSRTDFIVDREGKAWCLEVNTLPGLTPNSLLPRAAKLEGLTYAQLCEKIVELSLKKV
jgi:D-alanine-D-alanine ligase